MRWDLEEDVAWDECFRGFEIHFKYVNLNPIPVGVSVAALAVSTLVIFWCLTATSESYLEVVSTTYKFLRTYT
jgi:hypothetical protein